MDISLSPTNKLKKEPNDILKDSWESKLKTKFSLNPNRPIHKMRKLNKRKIEIRKKALSTILSEGNFSSTKDAFLRIHENIMM